MSDTDTAPKLILFCCKLVKRIFVIFGDIWKCVVLFKRIYIIFGGIWKYVVYAAFWVAGSCRLIEKSNWRTNTGSPYLPTPACLLSQKYKHKYKNTKILKLTQNLFHQLSAFTNEDECEHKYRYENTNTDMKKRI